MQQSAVSAVARDSAGGLIQLDVIAADAAGKPVPGLNQGDFHLFENGLAQHVLSFQAFNGRGAGDEPPVKIILLIDTLELPADLAHDERLAAAAFLRTNDGRLTHPVTVLQLNEFGLWALMHPSDDGNALAREIEHEDFGLLHRKLGWQMRPLAGDDILQEPVPLVALKALGQIATEERKRPGRKLLLWVGPGWGIGSGASSTARPGSPTGEIFDTVWWFSTLLREARLALYSFTVGENPSTSRGRLNRGNTEYYKDYLDGVREPRKVGLMNVYRKVLAVQSGGRVLDTGLDLEQQIESCAREAGPYYRISFDPFPADHRDAYHDLKVVIDRPGLTARTNTGYYDQPYYSIDQIPPPRDVSIQELQQLLTASHGESDAELAKQISELTLTERLSESRLASLRTNIHSKRVEDELRVLAASSAFLSLPEDEVQVDMPPDLRAQQNMLSLTAAYLSTSVHKLPDFFARQTTTRYQETPMYLEGRSDQEYRPLHLSDTWSTTVRYHNGFEVVATKPPKRKPKEPQLITYGVFGPALGGLLNDVEKNGGFTWSHWERGARGRLAVFRKSIPTDLSTRQEWLCCTPEGDGNAAYQRYAGYREEIAIDPESGVVLRFTVQAEPKTSTPLARSDIVIVYGPVEIGGKTYVCPLRSVTLTRGRSVQVLKEWDETFMSYGPYITMLNDIRFDQYHVFRSESRMLTDFAPGDK